MEASENEGTKDLNIDLWWKVKQKCLTHVKVKSHVIFVPSGMFEENVIKERNVRMK